MPDVKFVNLPGPPPNNDYCDVYIDGVWVGSINKKYKHEKIAIKHTTLELLKKKEI